MSALADQPQQKVRGRPFKKGETGNRTGRPKGSRDRATLLAENLMRDDLPAVVRSVVDAAISGDTTAAKLVLERLVPLRRGRPVSIDLPRITCARDLVEAAGRVTQAVATGKLTTDEGAAMTTIVDFQRRAIETLDLEQRLAALESRVEQNATT